MTYSSTDFLFYALNPYTYNIGPYEYNVEQMLLLQPTYSQKIDFI